MHVAALDSIVPSNTGLNAAFVDAVLHQIAHLPNIQSTAAF